MDDQFKKLVSHCKEYGFIYQSSEIYDGLSAAYDYGPYGVTLKNNIKEYWWRAMTQLHDNIVGIDAAILMHPHTWKASGHVDAFNDPMIDNKDSKKRYRADQLIESQVEKLEGKAEKEVAKARKRFGDSFDETLYRQTNDRVKRYTDEANDIRSRLAKAMNAQDMETLLEMVKELDIADPASGSRNWTEVRQFNLMFSTQLGSVAGEQGKLYLRPETAQGIFVNFVNVLKSSRQKVPFGIAQIGKAFRNEIVARQFIFRMREFEQMEMQYFVKPGDEMRWYQHWKEARMKWHLSLMPEHKYRLHDHDNLAHYANAAVDIEFEFPFGFRELEGIHSRTDFDLTQHQELSGKKLQYFDHEEQQHFVPYVVETSIGCDRMFLAIMSYALQDEVVPDANGQDSSRTILKLPAALAPVKCAILPLVKNNEALTQLAQRIHRELMLSFPCQYDEKDAIGRRYRRQDAIGTPICITIDFESLDDGQVTIRDRDSLEQIRIPIDQVAQRVQAKTDMRTLLTNLLESA